MMTELGRRGLFVAVVIGTLLAGACASAPEIRLGELRFRRPTAGTVDRLDVQPQRLVVTVTLQQRLTARLVLWLSDKDGNRRTPNAEEISPPPRGTLTMDLPLADFGGQPLPAGTYVLHMLAYDDGGAKHGGDSCVVTYDGPDVENRAVQCDGAPPPRRGRRR